MSPALYVNRHRSGMIHLADVDSIEIAGVTLCGLKIGDDDTIGNDETVSGIIAVCSSCKRIIRARG